MEHVMDWDDLVGGVAQEHGDGNEYAARLLK
jgi:hypothetical protein